VILVGFLLAVQPVGASAQFFDPAPSIRPPGIIPGGAGTPHTNFAPSSGGMPPSTGALPGGGIGSAPPPRGPALQSLPPSAVPSPSGQVSLALSARFGSDLPVINGGLHWRVYSTKLDQQNGVKPVRDDRSPTPTFTLPPGSYVVHAGFGLASATKVVTLKAGEPLRETFEIPAGGLRLEGRVGDARIPAGQISFDLYAGSQFEPGDKRPIVQSVQSGDVVLLPEGTYHIVSNYGDGNSQVRSDIRVQVAKLTDATVSHRAAIITLKLVNEVGGEARANTQWSVLTPGGDVLKEAIGAFPRVILAEGTYKAIARNDDRTYERSFRVVTGVDGAVEVVAR
jgi:hypothetical protein